MKMREEIINRLLKEKDEEYQKFFLKILKNDENVIGVRVPLLKKIAKEISKSDYEIFLSEVKDESFEEKMIEGFLIGYIKEDFNAKLKRIKNFSNKINNWAICDMFIANLKDFKKDENKEETWKFIEECLEKDDEFKKRIALVIMLDYYINSKTIKKVLKLLVEIPKECEYYYTNMAQAWLLATCYIKFKDVTKKYIDTKYLNNFVFRKTISKICDSNKVTSEEKSEIKKLRLKIN